MYKKILIGFAPLLAVAAFAVMPAMASAQTRAYGICEKGLPHTANCPAGERFVAFPNKTPVAVESEKTAGTGPFVLENVAKTADIECTTFSDTGTLENVNGVGKSENALTFDHCKGSGELAGCEINPPLNEIKGVVTDVVNAAGNVEVTIKEGFNVKCGVIELGNVTGKVTGTPSGNALIFTEATGLMFLGAGATITGSDSTVTTVGKHPVLVN